LLLIFKNVFHGKDIAAKTTNPLAKNTVAIISCAVRPSR
jgi:hypothetical protein